MVYIPPHYRPSSIHVLYFSYSIPSSTLYNHREIQCLEARPEKNYLRSDRETVQLNYITYTSCSSNRSSSRALTILIRFPPFSSLNNPLPTPAPARMVDSGPNPERVTGVSVSGNCFYCSFELFTTGQIEGDLILFLCGAVVTVCHSGGASSS